MVFNEAVFLPIWLNYYSRFVPPGSIFVIDHSSTDGSTSRDGFVRVPVQHATDDDFWRVEVVQGLQHELLRRYDAVLATDVDEIVAPDPEWGTLGEYIERFDEEFVTCIGYEVLHMRDAEPAFDPRRPVLDQRSHWYRNPGYDKPLLSRVPLRWGPGFHQLVDGARRRDPRLRMIHLHRMDYRLCLARHRERRQRGWNEDDVTTGRGYQNRISDDEEFEHWFYNDSCFEDLGVRIQPEEIPARWRGLV
jgi:hypothetical protein